MKNKNALYIVLGIGAGVLAYYLFCKKKGSEMVDEQLEEQPQESPKKEPVRAGGGGGGGAMPVLSVPKSVTPIATTTPLVVNVSSTTTTPKPAEITPVVSTPKPVEITPIVSMPKPVEITPVRDVIDSKAIEPIKTEITPVRTESAVIEKAIEPIKTTSVSTTEQMKLAEATALATKRLAFDGVGSLCFEVGDCLHDL